MIMQADRQLKYGGNGVNCPRKANKPINEEKQRSIQSEIKDGRQVLLTRGALRRHDLQMNCELRQFRCPKCFKPFWKTVLIPKRVAICFQCKIWLYPLERHEEFGVGRFICATPTCDNVFFGRCRATDTRQCKICFSDVKNPYIHPHFKPPGGPLPRGVRKPQRIANNLPVSKVHDCTGTCISTFVRQWNEKTSSESLKSEYSSASRGYGRHRPKMPTFDCDQAEAAEARCGSNEESDSDLQEYSPDRRRPHTKSQPNSGNHTHNNSDSDISA